MAKIVFHNPVYMRIKCLLLSAKHIARTVYTMVNKTDMVPALNEFTV